VLLYEFCLNSDLIRQKLRRQPLLDLGWYAYTSRPLAMAMIGSSFRPACRCPSL